ncbi:MAG: Ig-like domain-containing protein [Clostridia bacterium]|nr:Ig-like domain-containing protein [Clostridia bacterium]
MRGLLYALLVCLIAIVMILPIGIGALVGINESNQDVTGDSSQNEEVDLELSLSETEVVFNIGASRTLVANIAIESDSYIFQWDSADKDVASVKKDATSQNSCVITGLSDGETTVTVSIIDKSQFKIVDSISCKVTVIDSSISFSEDEVVISLDEGNTATVTATAPDGGDIIWSSEDESIATVSGGVITAHKAGQVYIVAKSGNIEGKILVKIYNSLFTLEEVKLVGVGSSEQIAVNGQIGEGAIWTSSDDGIATVDANGVVTGIKTGMVTVKATSESDGLTSSCVVIVKAGNEEAAEMVSGKKATAASNPGIWYYLCESKNVEVGSIPTLDNGVIHIDITAIGTSGANFFYLRYQPDDVGDVIYKNTTYIYSSVDNALIQINGKDHYLKMGLNRIELDYTSSAPKDGNPYQFKWKAMGEFYIIPMFEEISRIEKMTLSSDFMTLNTGSNKTFTLTATVPGQENPVIEWVSSNTSVATVVDGVVTAVGEGSSMITAVCGNLSATCLVTVEGETPIEGEELSSGNKSATIASPGNWFYLADGKSKTYYTPILDKDGNIHLSIESIDEAGKKYVYLRYQPETEATYNVKITIEFAGAEGSIVDISGGNVGATPTTLKNGSNTIEFSFTSNGSTPFQCKFYSVGNYVVNVTITEA